MPTYGPWTQEPDYDITTRQNQNRRVQDLYEAGLYTDIQQGWDHFEYLPEWFPVEDNLVYDVLVTATQTAETKWLDSEELDQGIPDTRLVRAHQMGTVGESDWGSGATARVGRHPWLLAGGRYLWMPADVPPGAVGIEFEDAPPPPVPVLDYGRTSLVRCVLLPSTVMKANNLDLSNASEPAPLAVRPTTYVVMENAEKHNGPPGLPPGAAPNGRQVTVFAPNVLTGQELPLAAYGIDELDLSEFNTFIGAGACAISTYSPDLVPPVNVDNNPAYENSWRYGWWIKELHIRWTVRPPRYRWVYDTEPIRRTFPRDDHLAGGAYQTWPPPKSEQESNRTFGGYV